MYFVARITNGSSTFCFRMDWTCLQYSRFIYAEAGEAADVLARIGILQEFPENGQKNPYQIVEGVVC